MRIYSILLLFSTVSMHAQAPIDGDVVDSVAGAPIASARVKITAGRSDPRYTAADARGHFHFDNLTRATLSVDHPGYLPSDPIAIGASQSTVKVTLTPGAVIYGAVTDPNGLPALASGGFIGQIFVQRQNALSLVSGLLIDDRGQYRSGLLAPGNYYVVIRMNSPDFWEPAWRPTYYPHALDVASAKPIPLSPGQQVRADIQVMRQTGVHVSGRVTVPPSDPPPPGTQIVTRVYLVSLDGSLRRQTSSVVTADRFEAADLLPGTYTVMAETRQTNSKPLFGTLREVVIGDRDVSDLDLQLQLLPEVTGKVTFGDGCAAAPVPVRVSTGYTFGLKEYSALTGPDGSFAFGTFTPGPLFISAVGPGAVSVWLGDRDITKSGFDYPTATRPPTPAELRIAVACSSGGAQ